MAKLKREYNILRKKFFIDMSDGNHRVPPKASDLRWSFLSDGSSILGQTTFDEDGDVESIEIHPALVSNYSAPERRRVLLHELTHMRLGPDAQCYSETKKRYPRKWKEETVRLAILGAPLL